MKIIESNIFKKYRELVFGMSTKDGGVSGDPFFMNLSIATKDSRENVEKNRELFFGQLGVSIDRVNFQKQVHSDISREIVKGGFAGDCDATFTNKTNVFLTVSVADCLPVFLYDPIKKVIGGIHAGWRGSANKIASKTINRLVKVYDVDPVNLVCFLGPCISQEFFEVGPEVGELFREKIKIKKGGKYHIDLKLENKLQLLESGVDENNIEISPHCTYKEEPVFHSYRRERDNSGRMFGVIGMIG